MTSGHSVDNSHSVDNFIENMKVWYILEAYEMTNSENMTLTKLERIVHKFDESYLWTLITDWSHFRPCPIFFNRASKKYIYYTTLKKFFLTKFGGGG